MSELREWINIFIQLIMLIVMIFGLWQVIELRIDFKNINADKVTAQKIILITEDESTKWCTYTDSNGNLITETCPENTP